MTDDILNDLLARADQGALPAVAGELAHQVRQKQRRRGQRRAVAAAFCSAFIALLVVLPRWHEPVQIVVKPPSSLKQLQDEAAAFDAAATLHERAAHALQLAQLASQRRSDHLIVFLELGASERIDRARDRAALLLLREGERAAENSRNLSSARESYQRAARLFPETPAGRLAAERLALLM